ncbi:MAG TPA: hypothetical protein DDZ68_04715 [Parvularcula sp.]|nr:hypothetical protein [Parvularcula sp.]
MVKDKFPDQIVKAPGRHAGAHLSGDHVEARRRQPAGAPHPGEVFGAMQADVARLDGVVCEGGRVLHAATEANGLGLLCRNLRASFQLLTSEAPKVARIAVPGRREINADLPRTNDFTTSLVQFWNNSAAVLSMRRDSELESGNVALTFALLLPMLLCAAGAGFDFSRYHFAHTSLQEVADAAAIAGARQYLLKKADGATAAAIAEDAARRRLESEGFPAAAVEAEGVSRSATVDVDIGYDFTPTLFVSIFESPIHIAVHATATASGGSNICVIGTDENATRTVYLDGNAKLTGEDCALFSNSKSSAGLAVLNNAKLKVGLSCTAGGYDGSSMNYDPAPVSDCPARSDPLTDRAPPAVQACDHTAFAAVSGAVTLFPGVYCEGLTIDQSADATFKPGVYVIKDGQLRIHGNSRATGEGVGFFFTGSGAQMTIGGEADVDFSAPTSGPLAGLLIFEEQQSAGTRLFRITSPNARRLVGTIYLPQGRFLADANGAVADLSEYTAIVARRIELNSDVNLVLNADYHLSNVPVPEGLGPGSEGGVSLRR